MDESTRLTLSRRTFLSAATLGAASAYAAQGAARKRKPNVIVIFTDDQGTIDAPGFGATDLAMPNLNVLANSGVRFTQFYAGEHTGAPA